MKGECSTAKITFIGGDRRMIYAAGAFADNGYDTFLYGLGKDGNADNLTCADDLETALFGARYVVFPLPWSRDGKHIFAPLSDEKPDISEILSLVPKESRIFGGMTAGLTFGHEITDYYSFEALVIKNALATAQGAALSAINATGMMIYGMNVAVIGFGRLGMALAKTLSSLGANVTVFARSETARTWASISSCLALPFSCLADNIYNMDCVFNTVPAPVFLSGVLSNMKKGAAAIELAFFGKETERYEAENPDVRVVFLPSLPGKLTPKTAGKIIYETLLEIIEEEDMK
ncbi:MAG: dipicolinate synthase subunit DpsA [Eubacteriales bacterium]